MPHRQDFSQKDWDDIVKECRNIGLCFTLEVKDVIYSPDGESRAIILQRMDGAFQITRERLCAYEEDDIVYFKPETRGYWCPDDPSKTIVDTVEHAKKLIAEDHWVE